MNPADTETVRSAIVARISLSGRDWLPIADLVPFMAHELGLSRMQGQTDLYKLLRAGRIERRRSATATNRTGVPSWEYRTVPR